MLECYTEEGEGMGKEHEQSGLEVVGRGVAVVLAAREVARLRPVARVVLAPPPPSFFWLAVSASFFSTALRSEAAPCQAVQGVLRLICRRYRD